MAAATASVLLCGLESCSTTFRGVTSGGGKLRPSRPLARHPRWDWRSGKLGRSKCQDMKTRFTCRRRRCLPLSSPFVLKGRKPLPGLNYPIGNGPRQSPTNGDDSLHAYRVARSDHYRRGGVTVPHATRCNRRVAPGRLSPAAPSDRSNPAPSGAREAGRGGRVRPFGVTHRFAGGPVISAPAPPSRATTAASVANYRRSSRPRRP